MLAAGLDDRDPLAAESIAVLADRGLEPPARGTSCALPSPLHRNLVAPCAVLAAGGDAV
jgi:hypothetical protein